MSSSNGKIMRISCDGNYFLLRKSKNILSLFSIQLDSITKISEIDIIQFDMNSPKVITDFQFDKQNQQFYCLDSVSQLIKFDVAPKKTIKSINLSIGGCSKGKSLLIGEDSLIYSLC